MILLRNLGSTCMALNYEEVRFEVFILTYSNKNKSRFLSVLLKEIQTIARQET